jgi:hypothetical protein
MEFKDRAEFELAHWIKRGHAVSLATFTQVFGRPTVRIYHRRFMKPTNILPTLTLAVVLAGATLTEAQQFNFTTLLPDAATNIRGGNGSMESAG